MSQIRRTAAALAAVTASAVLLAACSSGSNEPAPTSTGPATGSAEIFSWWTSGSESAALNALFDATKATNPNLTLVNAAVAGGAGTNAKQVLATRLGGGDIPETWQTHPGGELGDYVDQGVLTDLSDLYKSEGWDKVVPKALIDSMTYGGKTYAALTGVHRANVWWYNKALVQSAGVTVPANITFDQLAGYAGQLQAKGITPLCLGDKDIWTSAMVVEETIVGEIGADGWTALMGGTLKWSDAKVQTAVSHSVTALGWANSDHKSQDWAGAVALLAGGKCAFNLMGDWAYGELVTKQQKIDGTDFGYTILGDANAFVTVGDAFVVGAGSKNPAGATAFVKGLMSPEGQLNFNKLKGSSPVRSDVDVTKLGVYQQGAAKTLSSGKLVPSLVHGQALVPAADSQALADSVTLLAANGDVAAFAKAMDAAFAANK